MHTIVAVIDLDHAEFFLSFDFVISHLNVSEEVNLRRFRSHARRNLLSTWIVRVSFGQTIFGEIYHDFTLYVCACVCVCLYVVAYKQWNVHDGIMT